MKTYLAIFDPPPPNASLITNHIGTTGVIILKDGVKFMPLCVPVVLYFLQ
jgi:hypothetical protein